MRRPNLSLLAQSVPGPNVTAPRDGRKLNQTQDALFIAVLFERSRASGWVVGETGADGIRHYQPCPPPADSQARKGGPVYLSTKALRKRLVHNSGLFEVRQACQRSQPPPGCYSVSSRVLCRGGEWCPDEDTTAYLESLTPPIRLGQPDALIASLSDESLFSWCDLTAPQPAIAIEAGDWICPRCGIVPAIKGGWSSPPKTWSGLCGRAYELALCPTCLLVFHQRLSAMN